MRSGAIDEDWAVVAIQSDRLAERAIEVLDGPATSIGERERAKRALAACRRIGDRVDKERDRILALLSDCGLAAEPLGQGGPRQNHTIRLGVDSYEAAQRVATALVADGFERWERWSAGAAESFRRFADHLTVAKHDDVSVIVRIVWAEPKRRHVLGRVVRPSTADWETVDLPHHLWWGYCALRPIRLVAERLRLRRRYPVTIGPFLATPAELLEPLIAAARIDPDACVIDLGCGDGRLIVEAAVHTGCRAIGVERSPELVARARRRAITAGVDELVEIYQGDARSAPLDGVTVAFMFLPVGVVAELLPATLRRLPAGARLIAHEQNRLPESISPRPSESVALIAAGAVTVASCWTAPAGEVGDDLGD